MSFTISSRKLNPVLRQIQTTKVNGSRIPQYHAEEATKAIIPLMGKSYHSDKNRYFIPAIWEAFTKCQYVVPDDPNAKPADRAMWYKPGPSPPPEFVMSKKGWAE